MSGKIVTYISLGSNMGDRHWSLQKALFEIAGDCGSLLSISKVYESRAMGFEGADFLNACCGVVTTLSPSELLARLLQIESRMGRGRTPGSGYEARPIDLDILYYGDSVLQTDLLTVPHPGLHQRDFVLKPLADIAPQHYHPILKKDTRNLLQQLRESNDLIKTDLKLHSGRTELFASCPFLAIEGNIGAGKSTLAGRIAEEFNAKLVLERFADNPFLPKFYEDQSRYAFPLEMSFLADRYQQFTDDTSQFDLFKNFMVSDYDIYKSLIFAQITLQTLEFDLYRRMFNFMYKEVRKPDIYVYLYQRTPQLLRNIQKRGRDYEQSISADYLDSIHSGYMEFMRTLPQKNSLIIDMENKDFVGRIEDYTALLDILGAKILELSR